MAQIRLECDVPSSALTNDFPELQEKASRAYDLVQPLLAEVDPKFTVDFIDNAYDELELQDLLGEVLAAQNEVLKPTTIFENFQLLVRESNFESEADQKKFLQYYAELQPYLSKIDNVHNVSNFNAYLRELQEPSDFKAQGKKSLP